VSQQPFLPQEPRETQRLPLSGGGVGRFVAALRRVRELPLDGESTELRAAACEYVDQLKAAGEPPQRVLAVVKEVTRIHLDHNLDQSATREVVERLVRWCIERYYRHD
jgi:hypothetical protein